MIHSTGQVTSPHPDCMCWGYSHDSTRWMYNSPRHPLHTLHNRPCVINIFSSGIGNIRHIRGSIWRSERCNIFSRCPVAFLAGGRGSGFGLANQPVRFKLLVGASGQRPAYTAHNICNWFLRFAQHSARTVSYLSIIAPKIGIGRDLGNDVAQRVHTVLGLTAASRMFEVFAELYREIRPYLWGGKCDEFTNLQCS